LCSARHHAHVACRGALYHRRQSRPDSNTGTTFGVNITLKTAACVTPRYRVQLRLNYQPEEARIVRSMTETSYRLSAAVDGLRCRITALALVHMLLLV